MTRITELVAESGKCTIMVGVSLEEIGKFTDVEKVVVVTDRPVSQLYGRILKKSIPRMVEMIEIESGEDAKSLDTIRYLYEKFLELELDRSSLVVGVGGGMVCDVAGFAASTYLRGVHFGFIPTTLLAQVDASVGGKNGVNFKGYKNLIGTFREPEFCLIDFEFLKSLPKKELVSGFAEIMKCGAIADASLFSYLEKNCKDAFLLKTEILRRVVYDSVSVKAGVVARDEKESEERMKLNFGHTIGHAIEKIMKLPHGEAISIGMVGAANLSVKRGLLSASERNRLVALLKNLKLPTKMDRTDANTLERMIDAIRKDKKRRGDEINMVLLEKIGKAKLVKIKIDDLLGVLHGV